MEAIPPRIPGRRIGKVGHLAGADAQFPEWWQELAEIPEVDDYWELAWMIWASFELPWWVSQLHDVQNYYLAPLVPTCPCQKDFLSPPNPQFACWDI